MSYLNRIVPINDIQRYAVQTLHNYCAIIITVTVWVTLSYSTFNNQGQFLNPHDEQKKNLSLIFEFDEEILEIIGNEKG